MNNNQGGSGLFFLNNTTGYNCAGFSVLQKTTDGINWYNQIVPTPQGYLSIMFTDSLKGWSGGSILIHTTDGGITAGITQISSEIPSSYKLCQNYPNPFNPLTKIKYTVKHETSNVRLTVYDLKGKLIAEPVNHKHSAGTYLVDFDGSAYSSGVYFYSLIIDNKIIDTKKMVLIK